MPAFQTITCRVAVVVLTFTAAFAAPLGAWRTSSPETAQDTALREEIEGILADTSQPASYAIEAPRRLKRLGRSAVPVLLDLLEEHYRADSGDGSSALSEAQETAVLDAFERFGPSALRAPMERRAQADADLFVRTTLLRALARVGGAEDLYLLIRIASPSDWHPNVHMEIAPAFRRTCTTIFERAMPASRSARSQILNAEDGVRRTLVHAIGAAQSWGGTELLASLLGDEQDLDRLLLKKILANTQGISRPATEEAIDYVRALLFEDDPELVADAACVLGALEDFHSAEALIDLLDHESQPVASGARWSLETLSSLPFGDDARRWKMWYTTETKWYDENADRLFELLDDREPENVILAIRELSNRRIYRGELALELTTALHHETPKVRKLACLALARLGSPVAIHALIECLNDPDVAVAQAALDTLVAITGKRLSSQPEEWLAEFPAWED